LKAVSRTSHYLRKRRGLTLVEMLTVLFIVSILVAFVTGLARHAARAAETRHALPVQAAQVFSLYEAVLRRTTTA